MCYIFLMAEPKDCIRTQVYALCILLAVCGLYAFFRYMVFGEVGLPQVPAYLLNKVVALASAASLAVACVWRYRGNEAAQKFWFRSTANLAFVHVLLTLSLLSPVYYPKFFMTGRLTAAGELSILAGVLTALGYFRFHHHSQRRWVTAALLPAALGLHLAAMGGAGWIAPAAWQGGLPPISLLAFCCAAISLCVPSARR
ncbi:MAG TPA: hypothetical protein VNX25_08660 [Verrucomicrobiae bacterium]|nr:hypothetical protein [Verrucomicrobiae bacterium]